MGIDSRRNPVVFYIHRGGEIVATVHHVEAIEAFGKTSKLGTYDVDVISLEPVNGHTS